MVLSGFFRFLFTFRYRYTMNNIDMQQIKRRYESQVLSEKKVKTGIRAEELREKLDPEAAIVGLMNLGEQAKTCLLEDIPRLQFQAQILTTILKKCMPDLRTLEVKGDGNKATTLIIDMTRPEN
jgi:hypothetical protein